MMFRLLYWVSESLATDGTSCVLGVYTSIPDLVRYGLRPARGEKIRLSLVKLDEDRPPLGLWTADDSESLETELQPYVATEEFTLEHVKELAAALRRVPSPV